MESLDGGPNRAAGRGSVDSVPCTSRAVDICATNQAQAKALKMAETTAGTIPSSMNEGIKHAIIGSTLRTRRIDF
jgi:hypothetical protein